MSGRNQHPSLAAWFSTPNFAEAEIVQQAGYDAVVLDIEHGSFDLAALERYIPFLRLLGLTVIAKVLAPERGPIQQALDFGADAVAIPHVENEKHARYITQMGKFPTLGDRSFAGGRTCGYGPTDQSWYERQNRRTAVYPMIEDAGAFNDVSAIAALDTVDGVFVGPSDLSLRRNRGAYSADADDFTDIEAIAKACASASKPWIMPAWTHAEKQLAYRLDAGTIILTMEHEALRSGFTNSIDEMRSIEGV
ncbi:HpcH/HpaI aldolase family protein [Spelaeicoccus albus]|uniref:4-hydroxy-2-oxoheptanedioate aldolase n=1 Tax=Spelaeicoccus albus TaxID=1280376 RepID=A0A7Z0D4Q5_9MICO|nr:aldolase/citrate lyase family protein [Spelaeicoccus albus]NYI68776.1 4-hydroxy-2-oxoheptanedioate aldolase [Spelaeicoccus albus]